MDSYYNQKHTYDEIATLLEKIKGFINKGEFHIACNKNRKENQGFLAEYRINRKKQKYILMKIKTEDFCHSLQNTKIGHEDEVLYVFVPQVKLYNAEGEEEAVDVYTKFNIIDKQSGGRVVVISFHKRNKPINYLFRQ